MKTILVMTLGILMGLQAFAQESDSNLKLECLPQKKGALHSVRLFATEKRKRYVLEVGRVFERGFTVQNYKVKRARDPKPGVTGAADVYRGREFSFDINYTVAPLPNGFISANLHSKKFGTEPLGCK